MPEEDEQDVSQAEYSSSDDDSVKDYKKKGKKLGDMLFSSSTADPKGDRVSELKELLGTVKGK